MTAIARDLSAVEPPVARSDLNAEYGIWSWLLITDIAIREASTNGLEAMDVLHVAAAASVGASELITTEKLSRSIHHARAVRVLTIHLEE
jgi:hypothetical protein